MYSANVQYIEIERVNAVLMTSARVATTNKAHECAEDEAGARRKRAIG
jgi:hypothetical protein